MKINWKARLRNKTFLISASGLVISFAYQIMSIVFDFIPRITEDNLLQTVGLAINMLALLGVVVDPTTEGVCDSTRALTYCTENDVRLCEKTEEKNDG